ncbi:hypothetical protein Acr_10g0005250 [Actinidia rufa]|uniref:Uncharacterized protein n=1 Tax=Actinidia rufa TaxID=165716 RepID=A0A7J0F8U6_9ERIC|nr:hypothetical protein Acr_10g0005250 [Actinidia rufa]
MKVEIIARETIKPSYPTPNHHRSFKLSFLDQLMIADAATLTAFINGWASAALGFPDANVISRRFVFDGSKIAALKAKLTKESVTQPTRVEAVSALLWHSVTAASRSRLTSQRSSSLIWNVNLRPRLMPPLPEHSFGNLAPPILLRADEGETEISCFICHIKRGIADIKDKYGKKLEEEERLSLVLDPSIKIKEGLQKRDSFHSSAIPFGERDRRKFKFSKVYLVGVLKYAV